MPAWRQAFGAAAAVMPAVALGATLTVESGLRRHDLREHAGAGGVLVQESAWAPVIGWRIEHGPADPVARAWRWRAGATAWAADAHYDGRSQAGTPVDSRTATAALALEASGSRSVGHGIALEAGLRAERLSRRIRTSGPYAGLDERTTQTLALAGLRWSGAAGEAWVQAARGPGGTLSVRFDGGLADDARLHTGAVQGWGAGLSRTLPNGWRLSAEVGRLTVTASGKTTLRSGGRPIGTVSQPRWVIDRAQVLVGRSFD